MSAPAHDFNDVMIADHHASSFKMLFYKYQEAPLSAALK
jgi:hypothetical protein